MKLTVTQIVLGALAGAACYYVQMQVQTSLPWLEEDSQGTIHAIMVNAGAAMVTAHWLAVLTLALGLGVSITGIIYLLKRQDSPSNVSRRLMKTGLILAAMMVISSFLVNVWGFPTSLTRVLPDGRIGTQFWLCSRYVAIAHLLAALVFLTSLAILSCGLAGYLMMRRRDAERAEIVEIAHL